MTRYQKPNWILAKVANPVLQFFITRLGISPAGAQVLDVRGRRSGKIQTVPVNPIEVDGRRYLVAPRGETQWVRNFRAAGEGVLRVGQRREQISGTEVGNADKPPVLRVYLDRYHGQVGSQFGVPKDGSVDQLVEIAPNHPVFEIRTKQS